MAKRLKGVLGDSLGSKIDASEVQEKQVTLGVIIDDDPEQEMTESFEARNSNKSSFHDPSSETFRQQALDEVSLQASPSNSGNSLNFFSEKRSRSQKQHQSQVISKYCC
ncbi:unnamed protein product [Allacma fusca]|uniref:Uncharacterized protein n=1 Tax=Allacma fusca TaxID=39272 RepID=A0A8J2PKL9_9HEXA|nr:unnamed protein product [Allacma fusca]